MAGRVLWVMFLGYWAVLLIATHLPPGDMPGVYVNDKMMHLSAYALWGVLAYAALAVGMPHRPGLLWLIVPAGLLAGALDEVTQPLVGRSCEIGDWLHNAWGLAAAVALSFVVHRMLVRAPARG